MAIYAIHSQAPKFIFIINYKVMYSSLFQLLPQYFPTIKFFNKKQVKKFYFSEFQKFAVVRNPYKRAVSTYYDKCQLDPENNLHQENAQLQYCQHQLLITLNEIKKTSEEIVPPAQLFSFKENATKRNLLNHNYKQLKDLSFGDYVKCLTLIIKRKNADGHFENQYKVFDIPRQNPFYNPKRVFNNTKIIKLENISQDWEMICDQIGMKMSLQKSNTTDHQRPNFKSFYTKESLQTVANIYKVDFEKFEYPTDLQINHL